MKAIPTISSHSRDGLKVFVVPNGDAARGIWVDATTDLETVKFPEAAKPVPMALAPKGVGKGIKGGFGAVKF